MREPTSPALWIIPAISAAILALSASLLREASQIAPLAHELNRVAVVFSSNALVCWAWCCLLARSALDRR